MDRSVDIILENFLEIRIAPSVVSIPRHKGHQYVPADRQFTVLGTGTISDNLTRFYWLALDDYRLLG